MSFDVDIAAIGRDMSRARNAAVVKVCDAIIDDTPVLTGDLKGSWHTGLNADPTAEVRRDGSGMAPKQELRERLQTAGLEQTIVFANKLPYAERIEYDGYSLKAPEGMVRKNLARWPTIGATLERGSDA